jgi:hypothetical protein
MVIQHRFQYYHRCLWGGRAANSLDYVSQRYKLQPLMVKVPSDWWIFLF